MPGLPLGSPGVSKSGTVVFPDQSVGWGDIAGESGSISITIEATGINSTTDINSVTVVLPAIEPWAGYWTDAGITDVTARSAISDFFAGLATDSIQAKIPVFVLLGAETATAINVMQDVYHGALVAGPTFTQWLGVRGDGTTSYVDPVTPFGDITGVSVNSLMVAIGVKQDAPTSGNQTFTQAMYGESYESTYEAICLGPQFINTVDEAEFKLSWAVNDEFSPTTSPVSWGDLSDVRIYASRTGAATVKAYLGATEIADETTASVAFPLYAPIIGGYSFPDGPSEAVDISGGEFDTFDAKWYCIAEGLSGAEQALLDARIVTLITALEAL